MAGKKGPEVLGVGWCRTGTSSLKVALDILGFGPCFHGRFIPYLPELRKQCYAYGVGKKNNFPVVELFDEYKAAVDIPAGLIPLLLDAYPAAKVILTVRDPETWYASVQDVIVRLHRWVLRPFFWTTQLGRQYTAIIGWGLDYMFKGDLSKDNCIRAFNAHTEEVRARVPEDRLLIWRPQDGWEPLVKFLGVPMPSTPFPPPQNEGSKEMLKQMLRFIKDHPLASMGMRVYDHSGPLDFKAI
ncbi:hypothetical protein WJX75_002841 [Coccomyxa subellipsoidea]|uniref:P-loop containing nucleoside triphosphate hydrolase protein n=1 Tax=Coccomyxa subellipsoidea TaxID=248742 RepID=A0ABR2YM55_9CHLO